MEIYFKSKSLQKACNSATASQKRWGLEIAKKLWQRLSELRAADCLADISHLPPARCHELTGRRKGCFAVDLKHPYRLVFRPLHDPVPLKDDGSIDRERVTAILIIGVEDYHG
jgi:proteic killer suppression protein